MPQRKIIISTAALIFIIIGSFIYFLISEKIAEKSSVSKEKITEELLQSVTAPDGSSAGVSKEIIKSLTSPKGGKVPEDIINSLTAPK